MFFSKANRGFSLLEMALVLLITSLLMSAMLKPYGTHLLEQQRSDTKAQLRLIHNALLGYGAANSRLPCPLTVSSNPHGDCSESHGYVPSAILGIDGRVDENGLLIDSWGKPIRYSVSIADSDSDGSPDFTETFGMQQVGMHGLAPDLEVCNSAMGCAELRANQVPVVLLSTGPQSVPRSEDEIENLDGDNRFVVRDPDKVGGDKFDDLVIWVSENALYTHLIRAGVLP